jgi:hypothetical protein
LSPTKSFYIKGASTGFVHEYFCKGKKAEPGLGLDMEAEEIPLIKS